MRLAMLSAGSWCIIAFNGVRHPLHVPLQCTLLVGNYLKLATSFREALKNGVKVINHFASHSHVEGLLRATMDIKGLPKHQLLSPFTTSWESLVDAMVRLLKVRSAITYIMLENKAAFMDCGGSSPHSKAASNEVARICGNPDFWEHLDLSVRHLAPLKVSFPYTNACHLHGNKKLKMTRRESSCHVSKLYSIGWYAIST